MFGLIEFTDKSQAICPMKNIRREKNSCIVKYRGGQYEGDLLVPNETRERLEELQKRKKTEIKSASCKENVAPKKKTKPKNAETDKKRGKKTRQRLSAVISPEQEFIAVTSSQVRSSVTTLSVEHASVDSLTSKSPSTHISATSATSQVDDAPVDASVDSQAITSQRDSTVVAEPQHTTSQRLHEVQNPVIKLAKESYDEVHISSRKEQIENDSRKPFARASSPESVSAPPTHIDLPAATSSVENDSVDTGMMSSQHNTTIVPESQHTTSQRLHEVQNPVIKLAKESSDEVHISSRKEQIENDSRELFARTSSPESVSAPPTHIDLPAATSSVENDSVDTGMMSSQHNTRSVPESQHSPSQKQQKIEVVLAPEFNPVVKLEKPSYIKPKILNIRKISPNTGAKLLRRPEVPTMSSDSPILNLENTMNKHSFQEHVLLDPLESQQNWSSPCGTMIEALDEASLVPGCFVIDLEIDRFLDGRILNDLPLMTTSLDSATTPLIQENHQDPDFDMSFSELEHSSLHNTGTFAPEASSSSMLDDFVQKLTTNTVEDERNLMESDGKPAIKLVPQVPRHIQALSDGEPSDSEPDDPDYEPQRANSSDSASETENVSNRNSSGKLNRTNNSRNNQSTVSSGMDISTSAGKPGSHGIDDDAMQVKKSRGPSGDKKPNFCFYCHSKQTKISRHLELKHRVEPEVKKFAVLPKGIEERRKLIEVLRKKGNFLFNTQSEYNDGELIVSRRPNAKFARTAREFKACANCKAFFAVSSLRVHFRKCTGRSSQSTRLPMVMSKKVVCRVHARATEEVALVLFPPLREDDIVRLIRYDELVIVYANKMVEKYGDSRYYEMIRQRIRLLGRLLSSLRELNKEVTDLTSAYDPKFCDDVLRAVNIEAKLSVSTKHYGTPGVASGLGTLLKQIGAILITECIKKHDDQKKKCVKDFLKLLAQEITLSVNRKVGESQAQANRQKKVQLPSMEDVKKLHAYLTQKRNEAFQKLSDEFSNKEWINLAETTLTSVQLFNRRRAGEIERTLIEDFKNYQTIDVNSDKKLFESLSQQNQEIAKKYIRFTIRGKLNRTVPVLLDTRLLESIELLLHHRRDMKIKESNPYVFGVPGGDKSRDKYLRACVLMRKFSVDCGATHPERLRGTKLRKHIATTCISLNLSDNEVTDLANFMGHAEKIHKEIYRQPLVNREILRMSKLLEAAQGADDSGEDNDNSDDDSQQLENQNCGSDSYLEQDAGETNDRITSRTAVESNKSQGSVKRKRSTSPYGPVKRVPWNPEEKETVLRIFSENLRSLKLPSLKLIQETIQQNPCLQNRTPAQIKTWLHNQTKKK